jgi:hypothetical protein
MLKLYLARNNAIDATTERALLALDRLADAQYKLNRTWLELAYPEGKLPTPLKPTSVPIPAAAADPANKGLVALPQLPPPQPPTAIKTNIKMPSFDDVCKLANDLATEDEAAQKRVSAADAKADDAKLRYMNAAPADKATAKQELEDARNAYRISLLEAQAIRKRWNLASERVVEMSKPNR